MLPGPGRSNPYWSPVKRASNWATKASFDQVYTVCSWFFCRNIPSKYGCLISQARVYILAWYYFPSRKKISWWYFEIFFSYFPHLHGLTACKLSQREKKIGFDILCKFSQKPIFWEKWEKYHQFVICWPAFVRRHPKSLMKHAAVYLQKFPYAIF